MDSALIRSRGMGRDRTGAQMALHHQLFREEAVGFRYLL